jgi:hypothetical protein
MRGRQRMTGLTVVLCCTFVINAGAQNAYVDRPFLQDVSEKVPLAPDLRGAELLKVRADRNGRISVLSDKGLLQVSEGRLVPDRLHRPLADSHIVDIETHDGQFVYLTDKLVLSNAWAGKLLVEHQVSGAHLLAMSNESDFVVVGDEKAVFFERQKPVEEWSGAGKGTKQVAFDHEREQYLFLDERNMRLFGKRTRAMGTPEMVTLNCFTYSDNGRTLLIGASEGCLRVDPNSPVPAGSDLKKLPCVDIQAIRAIGDVVWFGTPEGAFSLHPDGRIDYYASRRWLVDDVVVDIAPGPENSVLVLTAKGLNIIRFKQMTLADKAEHFDKIMRQRHIRYGFNSALVMSEPGDLSTGTLIDTDNDGLWTAMYLASELFRYAVTKSDAALRNCYESFEAMERLSEITPMAGFPARTFERADYQVSDKSRWQSAQDKRWAWKATTSSDEIVGHFFAYTIFAEIVPDRAWRDRAVALMDAIMDHIVRNNWYLVDYDGKPTQWGRWNPEYVNQFPRQVGDRRLNSAEIISFLQAAYHFTGNELYKQKAYELFEKHGYLDNILSPIKDLARVPGIDLTTEWNHSDDELAFLTYWNLYRYAFTDELREKYRGAIKEHWEIERPEKNPLWNFIYADTGAREFDLEESIWTLKEFPLDTISWTVHNSSRKDLDFLTPDFRRQTTKTVLPPDERPMSKHNGNGFDLHGGDAGREEFAPDIYLLPYWLARYLGLIRQSL